MEVNQGVKDRVAGEGVGQIERRGGMNLSIAQARR